MCRKHWSMVPRDRQRALWAAYVPGQERRLSPSVEYLHAAAACVRAVAEKELHPEDAIADEVSLYLAWADAITDEDES